MQSPQNSVDSDLYAAEQIGDVPTVPWFGRGTERACGQMAGATDEVIE